jgi:chorismate mutase
MSRNLLLVDKKILPAYFDKVIQARQLLSTGILSEVSEACKQVGISRSTYYKYKDYVFLPEEDHSTRKAVLSMILKHRPGMLSEVLTAISKHSASIITMTQSMPIRNKASVVMTLDIHHLDLGVNDLLSELKTLVGVDRATLLDIE